VLVAVTRHEGRATLNLGKLLSTTRNASGEELVASVLRHKHKLQRLLRKKIATMFPVTKAASGQPGDGVMPGGGDEAQSPSENASQDLTQLSSPEQVLQRVGLQCVLRTIPLALQVFRQQEVETKKNAKLFLEEMTKHFPVSQRSTVSTNPKKVMASSSKNEQQQGIAEKPERLSTPHVPTSPPDLISWDDIEPVLPKSIPISVEKSVPASVPKKLGRGIKKLPPGMVNWKEGVEVDDDFFSNAELWLEMVRERHEVTGIVPGASVLRQSLEDLHDEVYRNRLAKSLSGRPRFRQEHWLEYQPLLRKIGEHVLATAGVADVLDEAVELRLEAESSQAAALAEALAKKPVRAKRRPMV